MSSLSPFLYFHPKELRGHIHDLATIAPLLSAVIAPLAVLYDIPALSERWYSYNGVIQPDFTASLVLSAISLAASIIANALLIIRFSLTARRWRIMTRISVIFWAIKVVVALTNLSIFGALRRTGHGYTYTEGFWSAVMSVILSGIVFFLLLLHWVVELGIGKREDTKTTLQQTVRVTGRHFMLQATLFIGTVAIIAVIFSFLEDWSYLQGIYFATVTLLTVGFGDYEPTRVSTKILLFPLALLGIAQLGSILGMIIEFFSLRAAKRKAQSRALLERERQVEQDKKQAPPNLLQEIEFLVEMNNKQDMKDQISELAMTSAGFLIFWVIGAALFTATETWSYPTSMYFCYVFFLSIGYGDFSPSSPAGRVIFIIYALLAVPIMAAFAVTAVQGLVTQLSQWRLAKRKVAEGIENAGAEDSSDVISHAEYVERHHKHWASKEKKQQEQEDLDARADEKALTDALINHALEVERHARRLLTTYLPNGSKAQIVLKADRNVQLRHLQLMLDQEAKGKSAHDAGKREKGGEEDDRTKRLQMEGEDDPDWISHPLDDSGTMEEVRRYRESFAAFLATSSRLRKLEGAEMYKAERRLMMSDAEVQDRNGRPRERSPSERDDSPSDDAASGSGSRKHQPKAKGSLRPDEELGDKDKDADDTL